MQKLSARRLAFGFDILCSAIPTFCGPPGREDKSATVCCCLKRSSRSDEDPTSRSGRGVFYLNKLGVSDERWFRCRGLRPERHRFARSSITFAARSLVFAAFIIHFIPAS